MAYVTLEDLRALIQERDILDLTNDAGTAADLSDPAVAQILADVFDQASQEIDAHLGGVADVPLAAPPRIVRNLAARIARYRLYQRRPNLGDIIKPVAADYNGAIDLLEQFAAGTLKLPGAIGGEPVVAGDCGLSVASAPRRFGDDFWKRMP
ncbi:gp436 family protein [Solidesulfovibrio sp.]